MCYESFECADGQFCQKLDGEFQGVCTVADIEDNNISTGIVKSRIWYISKPYFLSYNFQILYNLIIGF